MVARMKYLTRGLWYAAMGTVYVLLVIADGILGLVDPEETDEL